MTQGSLLPNRLVVVTLACPACAFTWPATTYQEGAYYVEGDMAQTASKQCYCVRCDAKPPMRIASVEEMAA